MKIILQEMKIAIRGTIILGILVCGIYPVLVCGIAQGISPGKAEGSLVTHHGKIVGSRLIGQGFTGEGYFHPRPSAAGTGYDAARSGGSNLGPISRELVDSVRRRAEEYRKENGLQPGAPVPGDAVTASASGLDPHISPENAFLQAPRVARARNVSEEWMRRKVAAHIEGRELGILGEPRVNVLMLNLDMDGSIVKR